jgi:hypothetical protein
MFFGPSVQTESRCCVTTTAFTNEEMRKGIETENRFSIPFIKLANCVPTICILEKKQ